MIQKDQIQEPKNRCGKRNCRVERWGEVLARNAKEMQSARNNREYQIERTRYPVGHGNCSFHILVVELMRNNPT